MTKNDIHLWSKQKVILNLRESSVEVNYNCINNAYHSDYSESVSFFSFNGKLS